MREITTLAPPPGMDAFKHSQLVQQDGASVFVPGGVSPRDGSRRRTGGQTRQQRRAEEREQSSEHERLRKEFNSPVTKGELSQIAMQFFASLEKMAGEYRKLAIRHESTQRVLVAKGLITKEEYEAAAREQVVWNQTIDAVISGYGQVPITDLINQVRQYNANPANTLKVEWHHIDLAPRLLQDEGMTLEDKLLLAKELDMPEQFIDQIRAFEERKYAAPITPTDADDAIKVNETETTPVEEVVPAE